MDEIINERTTAFLIRSRLNYDMKELQDYIIEEYPEIDCVESKTSYLKLITDGQDLNKILASFILEKIQEVSSKELPDIDFDKLVSSNIDIFFDVTYHNDSVLVENAEINY